MLGKKKNSFYLTMNGPGHCSIRSSALVSINSQYSTKHFNSCSRWQDVFLFILTFSVVHTELQYISLLVMDCSNFCLPFQSLF